MEKLRAIIIDDEQNGIDSLALLIDNFLPDLKVISKITDSTKAAEAIDNYHPDIVFLDVNMPKLNGFDVLKQLNFKKFNLIFTTAYQEYALKAIKNNAIDYLLKPIDINELENAIRKVKNNINDGFKDASYESLLLELSRMEDSKILITTKDEILHVKIRDIVRIESNGNYLTFYFEKRDKAIIYGALKDYESIVSLAEGFMRIHQSHLINLNHICRFYKKNSGIVVVLQDDVELPVARSKKSDLLKWFKIDS